MALRLYAFEGKDLVKITPPRSASADPVLLGRSELLKHLAGGSDNEELTSLTDGVEIPPIAIGERRRRGTSTRWLGWHPWRGRHRSRWRPVHCSSTRRSVR